MTYIFKIRSHGKQNTDDVVGEQVKEDWIEYKQAQTKAEKRNKNQLVEVGNFTGMLSQITSYEYSPDTDGTSNEQGEAQLKKIRREDWQGYLKQVKKTPAERAKNLNVPQMLWQAISGEDQIPAGAREKIELIQESYFREYPHRTVCNPKLYREVLPQPIATRSEPEHTFGGGFVRLAVRITQNDAKNARKYSSSQARQ